MYRLRFILILWVISLLVLGCRDDSSTPDSGNIKMIANQEALVTLFDSSYFIYVKEGILVDSPNLLDTIYLLLPTNLPAQYEADSLNIIVSGDIQKNPSYSSHNIYTSFIITKISMK